MADENELLLCQNLKAVQVFDATLVQAVDTLRGDTQRRWLEFLVNEYNVISPGLPVAIQTNVKRMVDLVTAELASPPT